MEVIAEYRNEILGSFVCQPLSHEDAPHAVKRCLNQQLSVVAAKIYRLTDSQYYAQISCIERRETAGSQAPFSSPVLSAEKPSTLEQPVLWYDKVCGAVVFRKGKERQYIIIKNLSGHIGFPKGHCEDGESEEETARREVLEEIGISVSLIPGFRCEMHYEAAIEGEILEKTGVYFLAAVNEEAVKIQNEEIPDWWTLPYEEALQKVNFGSDRNILRRAQYYCI